MYVVGYAEILRNVLACRGIECIFVKSRTHSYNQVKIGEKWYYVDLTNDSGSIKIKEILSWCLLSENFFKIDGDYVSLPSQTTHPSDESCYIRGEDGEFLLAGVYFLKELAEQGDAEAQLSLGKYYESGAKCDLNKAVTLYLLAAQQGNKEARRKLEKLKNDIIVNKNNLGGEKTGDQVHILDIINNYLRYLQQTDVDIARSEVDRSERREGVQPPRT